ncbi:MAG: ribonuclease H family protein [Myxococcales bacterium]|nr:ribonuclease H family protein [Myxococcales bacterium]
MPRERYYVVWAGREPGIYADWPSCHAQVHGYPGAEYRAYDSAAEAERAWVEGGGDPMPLDEPTPALDPPRPSLGLDGPIPGAIAVDAACSGNPGPMEYRGVEIDTGVQLFHVGPMQGTNNIGEFLAIVHGLAWLRQHARPGPIYSDSKIAIGWVHKGRAKTTLPRSARTEPAWALLDRAHRWLREAGCGRVEIHKWPTRRWGEIPADFGRK